MGLLTVGTPMSWSDTKKAADHVRDKGIVQFLNIYDKYKDRKNDCLKWGDEVEFVLVKFDHKRKRCQLLLKAADMLPVLQGPEDRGEQNLSTMWRPEYAGYMIEGTPGMPYDHEMNHLKRLEANMQLRRHEAQQMLGEDECVISVTAFPMLGTPNFTSPEWPVTPGRGVTTSLFFPDQAIFSAHPRFASLSRNIRERRGAKVAINVPVFVDKNTPRPFFNQIEDSKQQGRNNKENEESLKKEYSAAKPDHIYMDAMGFGMGCCCLQMTFQAQSIVEARHLYDQLTPLTPVMLALSAAAPIWRGYLSDVDCRWNVISGSCDDRTDEERGLTKELHNDRYRIDKSRYDSISCYLSPAGQAYNDVPLVKDEKLYEKLLEHEGIDEAMARHVSHLFIRDPLVIFKEKLDIDDKAETDHFENLQSTNWQTMRFKPPPLNSPIGWRVEFRPTELQTTEFENAAFASFVVLFTRALLSFDLNLLIPISQVDENMQRAQKRNACLAEKFYFRKNVEVDCKLEKEEKPEEGPKQKDGEKGEKAADIAEMTVADIINGCAGFVGCLPLIREYLSNMEIEVETRCRIKQYLQFIGDRASGRYMTTASWMRHFVTTHPKYKQDSCVTDEINYDLMWRVHLIQTGKCKCPELLPDNYTHDTGDDCSGCKESKEKTA